MSGFKRLSSDIRQEMLADAKDANRGQAFRDARIKSESMNLDEYIAFISNGMEYVKPMPTKRRTEDFRL